MRGWPLPLVIGAVVLVLAAAAVLVWPDRRPPPGGGLDAGAVAAALAALEQQDAGAGGIDDTGPLRFPADHGPHPAAPGEIWELSALLTDRRGRRYGLRFSVVRLALGTEPVQRTSAFAAHAVLAAGLTVADERAGRVSAARRVSRSALGLAGSDGATPGDPRTRVWVEDWRLSREGGGVLRLNATDPAAALDLRLTPARDPVGIEQSELLGRTGGEARGAGLRFYVQPGLAVTGSLRLDDGRRQVTGSAWLDHAWGSPGAVAGGRSGRLALNRFELMLEDGTALACVHLRRRSGGGTPIPTCAAIAPGGAVRVLRRRDLSLEPAGTPWTAADGTEYPLRWRLSAPALDLAIDIRPLLPDQQQAQIVPLWSGIVLVEGRRGTVPVSGSGRMDLTGYAAEEPGSGT